MEHMDFSMHSQLWHVELQLDVPTAHNIRYSQDVHSQRICNRRIKGIPPRHGFKSYLADWKRTSNLLPRDKGKHFCHELWFTSKSASLCRPRLGRGLSWIVSSSQGNCISENFKEKSEKIHLPKYTPKPILWLCGTFFEQSLTTPLNHLLSTHINILMFDDYGVHTPNLL